MTMLAGCGGDKEQMQKGLARSGYTAEQATCIADNLNGKIKSKIYDYMGKLMSEGVDFKEAKNKARRKYGPDFQKDVKTVVQQCVPPKAKE